MAEAKFGAIENTAQIRYCWAHLRLSDYIMLISNWVFKMKNNQVPRKTLARVWVLSSNILGWWNDTFWKMKKQRNLKLMSRYNYIHSFTHPPSMHTVPSFCKTGNIVATKVRWVGFYVQTTDSLWLPHQLPYLTRAGDNSFSMRLLTKLMEMKWGRDIYFVNYKGTLIESIKYNGHLFYFCRY